MEREKTSDEKSRNFLKSTEMWAAIAGVATGLGALWLELRERTRLALDRTSVYKEAKTKRDSIRKGDPEKGVSGLTSKDPEFWPKYEAASKAYKADLDVVHEELGIKQFGLESLKRRFKLVKSKSERMAMVEKAGTIGFMTATLVVGLGIITKLSERQDLKNQLDAKQASETAMKM